MNDKLRILAIPESEPFARDICRVLHKKLTPVDSKRFQDGNFWAQIKENVRGGDVYVVGSLYGEPPEGSTGRMEELKYLIHAAKLASAKQVTVVMPYFEGRQDRKDRPRVDISAARWARSIVEAGAGRVITMDLHASQIVGFFALLDVPADHLYASYALIPALRKYRRQSAIIVAPDVGGGKRAEKYAQYLGMEVAIIYKTRAGANQIKDMRLMGDVAGKTCILLDDLADTGGTQDRASQLLKQLGAKEVVPVVVHAVLSPGAMRRLAQAGIRKLITTDTVPIRETQRQLQVQVVSVAPVFAHAIAACHSGRSISNLFIENRE